MESQEVRAALLHEQRGAEGARRVLPVQIRGVRHGAVGWLNISTARIFHSN